MGPSAVRVAGLEAKLEALGHIVEDGGNISVAVRETKQAGDDNARYLKEITSTCTKLAEQVVATLAAGQTPLVFGGDHSIAVGTVSGVSEFYRQQGKKIGRSAGAGAERAGQDSEWRNEGGAGELRHHRRTRH
jgi:arginase